MRSACVVASRLALTLQRSLSDAIPAAHLDQAPRPFDVVTMQFCMHYAFETEARARMMLENVTRWLRPGGMFIATIPNSEILLGDLYALPEETEPPFVTGNEYYRVTFAERPAEMPTYGFKYSFWLLDAVDNVPEYVVHWAAFEKCVAARWRR